MIIIGGIRRLPLKKKSVKKKKKTTNNIIKKGSLLFCLKESIFNKIIHCEREKQPVMMRFLFRSSTFAHHYAAQIFASWMQEALHFFLS